MHLPDISEVDKELEELAKKKAKGQNLDKAESKIKEDSELDSERKKDEAIAIGTYLHVVSGVGNKEIDDTFGHCGACVLVEVACKADHDVDARQQVRNKTILLSRKKLKYH